MEKEIEVIPDETTFLKLLLMKAHYLLFFAGNSAIYPYIFVYAKQLGITADAIGYITATMWCATVLSRPILGGLADHFQKFKLVLICMLLISIASDLGLSFIPQPQPLQSSNSTTNTSVICLQNNSYLVEFETDTCTSSLSLCANNCSFSCYLCESNSAACAGANTSIFIQPEYSETEFIDNIPSNCTEKLFSKCDNSSRKDCINNTVSDPVDSYVQNAPLQLAMFSGFASLFFICLTTVESLTDAACGTALEGKMELYGRQRMWGTIGWGIFSLLAGILNHAVSGSSILVSYWPGFYMSLAFYVLDIGVIWKWKIKQVRKVKNAFKNVGRLLYQPKVLLFLLQIICAGMLRGIFSTYLLWYLESLGASQLLMGSVTSMQCFLGEVVFFFISGWLIQKIGHLNVITMSFAANGLRFLIYSFIDDPWWGMLIELLQGPAFGSFFAAVTAYVRVIAPKGAEATMQGITLAALEGIGQSVGSLLGGYWVHNLGARTTFYWSGIMSVIFGMASCIISGLMACKLIKEEMSKPSTVGVYSNEESLSNSFKDFSSGRVCIKEFYFFGLYLVYEYQSLPNVPSVAMLYNSCQSATSGLLILIFFMIVY
ncbi:major facilitator superfamily domain-containing protein 6 [Nephila pilipes]|uniref:Major facilitator superfamily domain-containing protein 6 n=1 Tax=Nephila pilipes TaxID=299642 RepID=A0A8X6TXH5_NEPPI|nr:major facilitator superfamily domain-containing protein 6 [Nephila pilipes]